MRFLELLWNHLLHGCSNRRWKLCSILERFEINIREILVIKRMDSFGGRKCKYYELRILSKYHFLVYLQFCGRYTLFQLLRYTLPTKRMLGVDCHGCGCYQGRCRRTKISISPKGVNRYTYFTNFAFCNCIVPGRNRFV